MPPKLPVRSAAAFWRPKPVAIRLSTSVCLFCSLVRQHPKQRKAAQLPKWTRRTRRDQSTTAQPAPSTRGSDARKRLEVALVDLQKHAANYVNLSRLQLGLRGLQQSPGSETIRIAVLGLADGPQSGRTARELMRLLLADPLKVEQEWEQQLKQVDPARPLIIRIGAAEGHDAGAPLVVAREGLLQEIPVSSPGLDGHNLEVLLTEVNLPASARAEGSLLALEESVLVPTVDIPTSSNGRYSPITTPVHKAVIVGDGILGAASIMSLPMLDEKEMILGAVNFAEKVADDTSYPFTKVNVEVAAEGLSLMRQDIANAMAYESKWFQGNMPAIRDWLQASAMTDESGRTKTAVLNLVVSLLRNATALIQENEALYLSTALSNKITPESAAELSRSVTAWAESAHAELQQQLDIAFTGQRWRKLGWWKLFWRVDDVGMLSSEMLGQRFLPEAEKTIIYLAGRVEEAGLAAATDPATPTYPGPLLTPPTTLDAASEMPEPTPELEGKWPTQIPYTRKYLIDQTVPALQALAQRLVAQALGTSFLTSSLAGLAYLSSFGLYESGSVAALGLVYSLGRLQKKWETARTYWEGEVREEGRKAVRATEASVAAVLDGSQHRSDTDNEGLQELRTARELVRKAEDALAELK